MLTGAIAIESFFFDSQKFSINRSSFATKALKKENKRPQASKFAKVVPTIKNWHSGQRFATTRKLGCLLSYGSRDRIPPGANPTTAIYNVSAVKIYNATSSQVRFENKNIFYNEKCLLHHWRCSWKFKNSRDWLQGVPRVVALKNMYLPFLK
jgi:hypothetical protein